MLEYLKPLHDVEKTLSEDDCKDLGLNNLDKIVKVLSTRVQKLCVFAYFLFSFERCQWFVHDCVKRSRLLDWELLISTVLIHGVYVLCP